MQQFMSWYGKEIKHTEVVKLCKMCNTTTTIVHIDNSFVDNMKSIISYVAAIELQYVVKFMQARIKDIADDMMTSTFLPRSHNPLIFGMWGLDSFCLKMVRFYYSGELENRRWIMRGAGSFASDLWRAVFPWRWTRESDDWRYAFLLQ